MSENVKDKVKQVLGLMGICPDYPVRLYCSFIAPRSTAKEPVNRDFLEIPDEWVYDGVIRYSLSSFVDDWEFRKAR